MTLRQCGISHVKPSSVVEIDLITYKLSISCYHTVSVSPSFPHYVDAEDMSKHIGACLCFCVLFSISSDTVQTQRTRMSIPVLVRALCVRCPPFQPGADAQDMSEHIGARLCVVALLCPPQHGVDATGARSCPVSLLLSLQHR